MSASTPGIFLPSLPFSAEPLSEAVLFGFDDRAFPFQQHVHTHLTMGQRPQIVIRPGPEGSHDEVVLFYGTVLRIGGKLHLWYIGNHGPLQNTIGYERLHCKVCYATSDDGIEWTKPDLGLVEFNGSKHNNIVALDAPSLWSTAAIVHNPDEPRPEKRFKMAYEADFDGHLRFCVAFSPDGFRWTPYRGNPVGPFHEMAGAIKFRGLFYVSGQDDLGAHDLTPVRRLAAFASADFEHWSPCGAVGLDRGPHLYGPAAADQAHQYEEIHLGAAMWNRGNVIVGLYGMWHGHPSGDRGMVTMDLGLALSHDAIHYHEPIRDFRIVPAREQPERPVGLGPSLMQGQGMENIGDRTLYWYSLWRGTGGSGVRVVSWARDRLGMLKAFRPGGAFAVSCPIRIREGRRVRAYINASKLGPHSQLRVGLVDGGFKPIPGYSLDDATPISADGFKTPLRWTAGDAIPATGSDVRLYVRFDGIRAEDSQLHAIYLETEE